MVTESEWIFKAVGGVNNNSDDIAVKLDADRKFSVHGNDCIALVSNIVL